VSESELACERPPAAKDERRRFRVVSIVALVASLPFVAVHLWQVFSASTLEKMMSDLGGPVPTVTQVLINLSNMGALPVIVLVLDVAVFGLMYWLARRYWIGLLFAPVFFYLALSALYYLAMVAPVFSVITLVK
jgi:hypothetical protein